MNSATFSLGSLLPDFSALTQPNTAEGLTALAVALIAAIAVFFLFRVVVEWVKSRRLTQALSSIVADANKDSLPDKYRTFRKNADSISDEVGNLWGEFHESLVYYQSTNRVHNTLDAAHFFNSYSLARGLTDNRLIAAIPGLLTAIGVMGTFAGLQMGLGGLELSSGEVQTLIDGIKGMIQGASIAFASSFWGVFGSVLFNFIEKLAERDVRGRIAELQNRLDYLFPRITAEFSLREIQEQTSLSAEALQGMAERIGDKMQEAMAESSREMRTGLEESLQQLLGPALEKLADNAQNSSQQAIQQMTDTFANRLGAHVDAQSQAMSSAALQMQGAIDGMQERFNQLNDSQETQQRRISENFEGLLGRVTSKWDDQAAKLSERDEAQNAALERLSDRLSATVSQLDEFQKNFGMLVTASKEASLKTYSAAQSLMTAGEKIHELKDSITTATTTLGDQTAAAMAEAKELSSQNQTAMKAAEAMIQSAQNLNAEINTALSNVAEASKHSSEGMQAVENNIKTAQSQLNNHVNELRDAIQQMMDSYADKVKTQTNERLREWNDQTNEFSRTMVNAVQAIQEVVDEIDTKSQNFRG